MFTENWLRFYGDWKQHLGHLGEVESHGIEIGCFEGRSSCWLFENILTHPKSNLLVVDPFMPFDADPTGGYKARFIENTKSYANRISIYDGFSQMVLASLARNRFDFVIVDGSHKASDVLEDAVMSWKLLKRGGVLIFDDYEWTLGGKPTECPGMAIDCFIALYTPKVLHKGYQVIVSKP